MIHVASQPCSPPPFLQGTTQYPVFSCPWYHFSLALGNKSPIMTWQSLSQRRHRECHLPTPNARTAQASAAITNRLFTT